MSSRARKRGTIERNKWMKAQVLKEEVVVPGVWVLESIAVILTCTQTTRRSDQPYIQPKTVTKETFNSSVIYRPSTHIRILFHFHVTTIS